MRERDRGKRETYIGERETEVRERDRGKRETEVRGRQR